MNNPLPSFAGEGLGSVLSNVTLVLLTGNKWVGGGRGEGHRYKTVRLVGGTRARLSGEEGQL